MNRGRKGGGGNRVEEDIPDELRCKRSDGKQWRCTGRAMEGKTLCEKHYNQAKKRASGANASTSPKKKVKMKEGMGSEVLQLGRSAPSFAETRNKIPSKSLLEGEHRMKPSKIHSTALLPATDYRHSGDYRDGSYRHASENRLINDYRHPNEYNQFKDSSNDRQCPSNGLGKRLDEWSRILRSPGGDPYFKDLAEHFTEPFADDYVDQQTDTCHQCQRNDRGELVGCLKCGMNQYCVHCISKWYAGMHEDVFRQACPCCRGACSCKVCMHLDNSRSIFSEKLVSDLEKVNFYRYMLAFIQPLLQKLHQEQCEEVDLDINLRGDTFKAERSKLMKDERLYWELRRGQQSGCEDPSLAENPSLAIPKRAKLRINEDGSILCATAEQGGCGASSLVLKRILKSNWISKLVAEVNNVMPEDYKPSVVLDTLCPCRADPDAVSMSNDTLKHRRRAAYRPDSEDNYIYCPTVEVVEQESLDHFQKHWIRGEPVIVCDVLDETRGLRWDPIILWRAFRESTKGKTMGALDCLDWCPVEISINQFFKGYMEGRMHKTGWPELLKMREVLPSNFFEERLPQHGAQLISSLPLHEYINSRHGVLNLASKLPDDFLRPDFGPKPYVAYGMREELERGDCVAKLHYDMSDMVNVLTHAAEVKLPEWQSRRLEKFKKLYKITLAADLSADEAGEVGNQNRDYQTDLNGIREVKEKSCSLARAEEEGVTDPLRGEPLLQRDRYKEEHNQESIKESSTGFAKSGQGSEVDVYGGVLWDVFRRRDVPKLYEYLSRHIHEFRHTNEESVDQITHPIFDQTFYLTKEHQRKLKVECGVEPWSFEQHVGDVVFIPAGCPYQSRNLKSCISVGLGFVSPESLGELVRLSEEFRLLPKSHPMKEDKLEVKKMMLYAANKAVKDMKHLTAAATGRGELQQGSDVKLQ